MCVIRSLSVLSMIVVTICFFPSHGIGQETRRSEQLSPADSARILRSILAEKRSDLASLERILEALNTVDSIYKSQYPTWVVHDEDLRQRIFRAFRIRHWEVPQDSVVKVVTSPDGTEAIEISIGSARLGRLEARTNLSDSLQRAILAANYPLHRLNAIPAKTRKSLLFGTRPKAVSIDASAYGATLLFSNGWGVETKIGHDEIGYPFWLTGSARVFAIFNRLKIGVTVPVQFGRKQPAILDPLAIRRRQLNGATGFSAEFDQDVNSDLIGARFTIGELNKYVKGYLTDERRPYSIHTVAQLFYVRNQSLGYSEDLFTLTAGVGFHQIALGEVQSNNRIVTIEKSNFLSPLFRFDYTRHGTRMYGVSVQYYSSILLVAGWLEFVKDFIYLDLRYSTPIIRDPRPWEQSYFVMVSPRFRLGF